MLDESGQPLAYRLNLLTVLFRIIVIYSSYMIAAARLARFASVLSPMKRVGFGYRRDFIFSTFRTFARCSHPKPGNQVIASTSMVTRLRRELPRLLASAGASRYSPRPCNRRPAKRDAEQRLPLCALLRLPDRACPSQ